MFDLPRLSLVYLVRNRGRVVSKDDLIQGVWGGRIVWDSALTTRLNAASQGAQRQWRSAVCHSYRAPQGVRFIGEVSEDPEPAVPIEAARAAIEPPTTPRLSIVVPPFANMSRDPDQEFFADRIVEEIITALSRIRWLFVMARYWSFTYKGQAIDVKQLGRDLGVRDVLEGSVRKAGGRMRITAQLIDAQSGAHLQADASTAPWRTSSSCRIKWHRADVIEPALRAAETARSANPPTDDLTVYNL